RVSVLSGRVVSAYVKNRPEGSAADDLRPNWRYERTSLLPQAIVNAASEAARRVGLDYAGVDVIEDRSSGRVYCLEANAAPGMSEDTVRSLYARLQQALRGRAARASGAMPSKGGNRRAQSAGATSAAVAHAAGGQPVADGQPATARANPFMAEPENDPPVETPRWAEMYQWAAARYPPRRESPDREQREAQTRWAEVTRAPRQAR